MKTTGWVVLFGLCVGVLAGTACSGSSSTKNPADMTDDGLDADGTATDVADQDVPQGDVPQPDASDVKVQDADAGDLPEDLTADEADQADQADQADELDTLDITDTQEPEVYVPYEQIISEPGFEQGGSAWTAIGQASFVDDDLGHDASIWRAYLKGNDGSWLSSVGVAQLISMPSFHQLPASLNFYHKTDDENPDCSDFLYCNVPDLQVVLGGTPITFQNAYNSYTYGWIQSHHCLGEADMAGGALPLLVELLGSSEDFDVSTGRSLDDFSVQADATCPDVGELLDGGFEEAVSMWTGAQPDSMGTVDLQSSVDPHSGSQSLLATYSNRCATSYWTTWTSVPKANHGPAISFYAKATGGDGVAIFEQPGVTWYQSDFAVWPTTSYQEYSFCLPNFTVGHAVPLRFGIYGALDENGIGCGAKFVTVGLDDVALQDSPDCVPDANGLVDGGFERLLPKKPAAWYTGFDASPAAEGDARTGSGALKLAVTNNCDFPSATQLFQAPQIPSGQVLRVTFWARMPKTGAALQVTVRDGNTKQASQFDQTSDNYVQYHIDIASQHSGHVLALVFETTNPGGGCGPSSTPSLFIIDDVTTALQPL